MIQSKKAAGKENHPKWSKTIKKRSKTIKKRKMSGRNFLQMSTDRPDPPTTGDVFAGSLLAAQSAQSTSRSETGRNVRLASALFAVRTPLSSLAAGRGLPGAFDTRTVFFFFLSLSLSLFVLLLSSLAWSGWVLPKSNVQWIDKNSRPSWKHFWSTSHRTTWSIRSISHFDMPAPRLGDLQKGQWNPHRTFALGLKTKPPNFMFWFSSTINMFSETPSMFESWKLEHQCLISPCLPFCSWPVVCSQGEHSTVPGGLGARGKCGVFPSIGFFIQFSSW